MTRTIVLYFICDKASTISLCPTKPYSPK